MAEPGPESAGEWLRRARSNLIRASQPKAEGVYWEDLCFDAQQAAEKALKALLLARGIRFRYVHDLAELMTNLQEGGLDVPEAVRATAGLSTYAVTARYPGPIEPATEEEYLEAFAMAETVVRWVEVRLASEQP